MSKKIVMTGATGLIGTHLFNLLISRDYQVYVLTKRPNETQKSHPGAQGYYAWNASEEDSDVQDILEGSDAVIHLAGAAVAERWSSEHKKLIYDSRIIGTRNLVNTLKKLKNKPEVLISASAIGFYGHQEQRPDVPILDESSPAGHDFLAQVCVDWEAEALKAEEFGTRVALIRTGIVLSTKGGALGKMVLPFKFFLGGPIGSGQQWVSWIHIDDESEVFFYPLTNKNIHGPINAVSPNPVTMQTFADAVGNVLFRPSAFPVPKFVLQAMLGEAADVVGEGQKVAPNELLKHGFEFKHHDVLEAVKDLLSYDK